MVRSKEIRFRWISARHVVCRFYLPHGSPQRAKHNAREGGNIGRGAAKGEEI